MSYDDVCHIFTFVHLYNFLLFLLLYVCIMFYNYFYFCMFV